MEEEYYNLIKEALELCTKITIVLDKIHDLIIDSEPQIDRARYLVEHCKQFAGQRTPAWFKMRNSCITASDIGAVLKTDKYQSTNALIKKKVAPQAPFANIYTIHGNTYEDIAVAIYERLYDVKVYEASLLIHPIFPFIGASCDGFVIDEKNNDAWLIEIKCPFRREPVGKIPTNYIEQPRTQMACTKINRCSFFECKIVEYNSRDETLEATDIEFKGVIARYNFKDVFDYNDELKSFHIYPPGLRAAKNNDEFNTMVSELIGEVNRIEESGLAMINVKFIYWGLAKYTEDFINRDPDWMHTNVRRIEYIWNLIEKYRIEGIDKVPSRIKI